MFNFIFKRKRTRSREDYLAPETKPVIGAGRIFVINKDSRADYVERVDYKLIMKKRRQENHSLY